ncbi:MAG TPA: phosphonate ABC transporter ATP-binding protein [Casimicrobium sp.]|nr:phosphonate ABC transporter ATP-binding protein [Casimicrobium sp.]
MSTLSIKHLVKEYVPGKPVLKDISLDIEGRGITAIIGPSGTGKSTLIRCVNRLIDPTAGEIWFEGKDLAKLPGQPLREARRRIGMVFQEYNLVERLTVMENVLSGRLGYMGAWAAWRRKFSDEDIQKAFSLLQRVGLADFANRRADELSGGQRQRVGIARAVMQSPGLLLADEPTSSLDPKTSVEIMEIMRDLAADNNIPVMINIHQVELGKRYAERIIGMSGGLVVYDGAPDGLDGEVLRKIYGGQDWLAT